MTDRLLTRAALSCTIRAATVRERSRSGLVLASRASRGRGRTVHDQLRSAARQTDFLYRALVALVDHGVLFVLLRDRLAVHRERRYSLAAAIERSLASVHTHLIIAGFELRSGNLAAPEQFQILLLGLRLRRRGQRRRQNRKRANKC